MIKQSQPQIIARGAEAVIYKNEKFVIKHRVSKGYRNPELDRKIIKSRTKSEAKILTKASEIINCPKPFFIPDFDFSKIKMPFIKGEKLSEHLDKLKNKFEIMGIVGKEIAKLHDNDIIHGDLTTSNMILVENSEENNKTKTPELNGMENFKKQLLELKKLNFPKDKYTVFGSGPLAIRGIRDSKDIDIIVKRDLWEKLIKKYKPENKKVIKIGTIEIYRDWFPWIKDTDKLINNSDIFDSVRFVKLNYVLDWKKKYNRKKDKEDIKLIKKFVSLRDELENFKVFIIDFGLGFHSRRIEDKAVDLHLIKQALEAKHFQNWEKLFESFIKSYNSKDKTKILEQLKKSKQEEDISTKILNHQ